MVSFFLPLVLLPLVQFSNQKQEFLPIVHSCLWCCNTDIKYNFFFCTYYINIVYRQHLALACHHIINLFIVLKEVYPFFFFSFFFFFFFFLLNMSGSADLRKGNIVKKRLSDGILKEYTAQVSKQKSGASLTANQGSLVRVPVRPHTFVEIYTELISTVKLPLPLFQEVSF